MVISLYTAEIKLNKTDEDYHKYLMVVSPTEGILCINRGLFSISFECEEALSDIEIKDKKYIGDVTL